MAELKGNKKKKRLTINLSIFANNDQTNNSSTKSSKSPKNFEGSNGVVGLGIVAAMNQLVQTHDPFFSAKPTRAAILAVSPRSNPIPIFSNKITTGSANSAAKRGPNTAAEEVVMELSEDYTCVISHIGNNLIKKREYFDGDVRNRSESTTTSYWVSSGVFSDSSSTPTTRGGDVVVFRTADFLSSCYLCKKQLHGLDIFMYRGEKAFCSTECRYKQISIDEHKEKCDPGAMKPIEYSVSPCSGQMQFFTGVAAA